QRSRRPIDLGDAIRGKLHSLLAKVVAPFCAEPAPGAHGLWPEGRAGAPRMANPFHTVLRQSLGSAPRRQKKAAPVPKKKEDRRQSPRPAELPPRTRRRF